jgi:ribosome-associated protein
MRIKEINQLKKEIENILNNNKAVEITSINLKGKTSIADFMIIASGNSSRHIQALSETLVDQLKKKGINNCRLEGRGSDDWKLIDAIDIIIHIFHPEKRKFYDLEKMWSELIPKERLMKKKKKVTLIIF